MNFSRWTVIYYKTRNGESLVVKEVVSFGPKAAAKILRTVDLLEEFGLTLGGDYVDHITEKIWNFVLTVTECCISRLKTGSLSCFGLLSKRQGKPQPKK